MKRPVSGFWSSTAPQAPQTVVFIAVFDTVTSDTDAGYLTDITAGIDRSLQAFVSPVGITVTTDQVQLRQHAFGAQAVMWHACFASACAARTAAACVLLSLKYMIALFAFMLTSALHLVWGL